MILLEAFYRLEPWGNPVEDFRFGKALAEINRLFNWRYRIKDGQHEDPRDHFPGYDEVEREKILKGLKTTRQIRKEEQHE